jgi:Uncharacterised MFS-type transporter YbfB
MVITMTGMQEARRIAVQSAPRLMAATTAAFAAGQLVGPLTLTAANSAAEAIRRPSLFAASVLFITALALLPGGATYTNPNSPFVRDAANNSFAADIGWIWMIAPS